jgi:predicted permease
MQNILQRVMGDENFLGAFFQTVIIIALGYFFRRKKIVDDSGKKIITSIVWKISVPCVAFNAFMQPFNRANFITGLAELFASFVLYAILVFFGRTIFFRREKIQRTISGLFVAVGQTTLFSMPILLSVYDGRDKEVMIYISSISIAFRIMVYVIGFYMISGERFKLNQLSSSVKKIFCTPIMIGMFLGLFIWLFQDYTPQVQTKFGTYSIFRVDKTLSVLYMTVISLTKLLNPLSMFLIGMSVGEANFLTAVKDRDAWLIALMRNFFAPVFVLVFAVILHRAGIMHFDEFSLVTLVIAFSAPVSVTLSMMCVQYKNHEILASRACLISTAITLISMPLMFVLSYAALNFLN